MSNVNAVTLDDVLAARERIAGRVHRTNLVSSRTLSERLGTRVHLKLELFQKTGSFKPRGSFNKLLSAGLPAGTEVAAFSGGNHAQAVAYAAHALGLRATIFMPVTTPQNYLDATRGYGANVVLMPTIAAAMSAMAERERAGVITVHPFDDPLVIAGQGTVALEILEDLPSVTDIVVSIGGGGLIGGVAVAAKALKPSVRIWGVETVGADAMAQALAAGAPVPLPAITSIAKTLGAPVVTERTLGLVRDLTEGVTVVTDAEAVASLEFLLERVKVLTEPASACTLAAAEKLSFGPEREPDREVVLVLCGGNVSVAELRGYASISNQKV
ncbi:MAG: pyridoxal-phosphate dependent enzyme [Bryobacteraceae bacterium]|nr:pyridoxal-phosphate dependent enzyme [Bryobacteraceae bacterium]